jgi:replicative DNA helicase
LGRLLTETPIAGNIEHHVGLIRDVYLRRRIIKAANDAITTSLMPNRDLEGIFRKWQNDAFDLYTADNARDRVKSFPELVDAAGEQLEAAQQRGIKPGIQTDLYELDRVLTGLQPSNLYILAARPSMGKTALAMRITVNIAVSGNPVAFMSLEMSKESLTLRALCAVGGIAFDRAFNGCLNDDEWIQFVEAQSKIHQSQIFIDDSPALHYQDIARRLRRLKRLHGIKLAIIDYLQLAQGDKSNGRVIEVTSISAGLVAIAKELNIPILALSQLSRACESRNNKRPQLSDLRDSGAIEQDAYAVIALYNDGLSNETEAIVLKNRNGKTGTVLLGWDGPSMNFYNCLKGKNAA